MGNPTHQREESAVIGGFAGSEGYCAHRPAVKPAGKPNELGSAGGMPGQFDRSFHAFGTGIGQKCNRRVIKRRDSIQVLG